MNSASPSMMQSLAAAHGAVRDALKAAAQALSAGGAKAVAQEHWQSAHAAMQVVNHRALMKFSAELGALIAAADSDVKGDRAVAFSAGSMALVDYVAALIAGRRDQPLRLFPAYEKVQRARGITRPSESD